MVNFRKISGYAVAALIFSVSIFYIIANFQWKNILEILVRVDLVWLLCGGTLTILTYWIIRTLRWHIMLKAIGVHIDFSYLYLVSAISMALTIITPFQSGEALKVELLKKSGSLERVQGYSVFMAERLIDLMIVVLLAALSVLFGITDMLEPCIVILVSAVLIAGFMIFLKAIEGFSSESRLGAFFRPISQCMGNAKAIVMVTLLTIAGWLVVALSWYACLKSISINISFFQSVALTSIITVINILSLIPGAVGISEVSITAFLTHLGKNAAAAQAGGIILRIYGFIILFLGLTHYLGMVYMNNTKRCSTDK